MSTDKKDLAFFLLLLVIVFVSCFTMSRFPAVFIPLIIAVILAYVLDPFLVYLESKGINRVGAIAFLFSFSIILIVSFGYIAISNIVKEFNVVQANISSYADTAFRYIPYKLRHMLDVETPEKLLDYVTKAYNETRQTSAEAAKEGVTFLQRAFSSTFSFIFGLLGYFIE